MGSILKRRYLLKRYEDKSPYTVPEGVVAGRWDFGIGLDGRDVYCRNLYRDGRLIGRDVAGMATSGDLDTYREEYAS